MTNKKKRKKKIRLNFIISENFRKDLIECKKNYSLNISEICRKALEEEIYGLKENTSQN